MHVFNTKLFSVSPPPLSFHYDLTTKKTLTSKNKNISANKQGTP